MDKKALLSAYQYAKGNGYGGSQGDFVSLLKKDKNALNDIHGWAQSQGYKGGVDNFSMLIGVEAPLIKKKEESGLPSVDDGISLDTPEMGTPKPSASSATRKVKTPSKFNKNIESSDYQRHTKLASVAIEAAKKKDATTVANTLKEMNSIRAMYPKEVFGSDKQMADDLRVVNEMAKRNNLSIDVEKGAVLPAKAKPLTKIELPKGVVAKASDIKYTPDEMKKIISADMLNIELADVDLNKANQIVEDEFSGNGILDKVTKTINNWTIRAGMGYIPNSTDRAIAKATNKVKSKNPDATPEEILKYAKEQRLKEVIDNQKDKAVESYFEGWSLFSPEKQNEIEATLEGVKTKQEYHIARFNEKKDKIDRNLALLGTYKAKVGNGEALTPQEMMEAKRAINDVTLTYTDLERNYKNIESDTANLKSTEEELDRFKRNYSYITNTATKFGAQTVNILGGFARLMDMSESVGGLNKFPNPWDAMADVAKSTSEAMLSSVSKSDELKNVNSVGDFAEWAGELMVTQAPQLVMAYTTGGAAIPLMGASAAGQKFGELKDNQDYSSGQKMLASLVVGLAEGLSEKIELDVMKQVWPSSRMARAATRTKTDADVFKESLRVGMKGSVLNSIETLGLTASVANKEGISELVAQLGGNITDKYVLDKDVSILDGIGDAYLSGVVIGGAMMAAPTITAKVVSPFVHDPEKRVSKNVVKLNELARALDIATKESDRSVIQKQIDKLNDENFAIVDAAINRTKRLSPDEIREGVSAVEQMQKIKSQIGEISQSNEYTPEQKATMTEGLIQDYNELVLKRRALIDKANAVKPEEESQEGVRKEVDTTKEYITDLQDAKKSDPETYWSVDYVSEEAAKEGTVITTEDGGVVVSKDGDIKGLFKKASSKSVGVAKVLLERAIKSGGVKLDNFDIPYLTKMYKNAGFRVVSRIPFDEQFAPDGWNKDKHGTPDVVAMVYDPNNELNIEEKKFESYDEAMSYRDSYIKDEIATPTDKMAENAPIEGNIKETDDNYQESRDAAMQLAKDQGEFIPGDATLVNIEAAEDSAVESATFTFLDENGDSVTKEVSSVTQEQSPKSATIMENVKKAISKVFPDLEVLSFKSAKEMRKYVKGKYGDSVVKVEDNDSARVLLDENNNPIAILVNEELSDDTSIPHEVWHAILLKSFGENQALFKKFRDGIRKVLSDSGYKDLVRKLDAFSAQPEYTESGVVAEEWLAQLGGELTALGIDTNNLSKKEKTLLDKLRDVINKFAVSISGQPIFSENSTPEDVLDFMIEISDMMSKGEDVSNAVNNGTKEDNKPQTRRRAQTQSVDLSMLSDVGLGNVDNTKENGDNPKLVEAVERLIRPRTNSATTSRAQKTPKDRMSSVLDGVIQKSKERKAAKDKIYKEDLAYLKRSAEYELADATRKKEMIEELRDKLDMRDNSVYDGALGYLQGSSVYINANDVEREALVREMRKKMGLKEKSVNGIFSLKRKEPGITVSEKQALKSQIILEARAAKDAIKARQAIGAMIKEQLAPLFRNGKIKTSQLQAINKKLLQLNFFNQDHVDKFVNYMDKVFRDAEYAAKLARANSLQSKIKKAVKDKTIQAETRDTAKEFAKLAPYLITDIDAYLAIADEVYGAVQQTKATVKEGIADVSFKKAMNYERVQEYTNVEKAAQEEVKKQQLLDRNQYLAEAGVIDGSMSLKEMAAIIDAIEKDPGSDVAKDKEKTIRDYVNKYFDSYRTILSEIIATDIDPFTGERMNLSAEQRDQISKFLDVDLDVLTLKEAYHMVNAIDNFVMNQNTDGMDATIRAYTGIKNAKKAKSDGMVARALRSWGSKLLGRKWAENFEQITMMHERMFGGVDAAIKFDKLSGLSNLLRDKVVALKQYNNVIDRYARKFGDIKDFNKADNVFERGMLGIVARNVQGSEIEQQEEFNKEKDNIRISINAMKRGTERQIKESVVAQEVYDRILDGSNSYQEAKAKANPDNVRAVEFWQNEFAEIFDDLQRVSRGVYNFVLDRDVNYLPYRWKRFSKKKDNIEANDSASSYMGINDGFDTTEAGVLMKATKPRLSEDGDPKRIFSFDFDSNMANSIQGAFIDINTAATIRQISAFYGSNELSSIMPKQEDRDLAIERMTSFVRRVKRKQYFQEDNLDQAVKALNYLSSFSAGRALGGLSQIPKQTISVAANTIINTGGNLDIVDVWKANDFIDNSGYGISVRGIASQADIQSVNQILKKADESKGKQMLEYLKKVNDMYLEHFVARPDVFIARASWLSYYKKKLRAMGVNTNEIEWDTHELNTDAADYAQRMTDRQQNYSDPDLAGELMASRKPIVQLLRKSLFPFASFTINKKAQIMGDMSVLQNPMASSEDKKSAIRSLASWGVEQVVFNAVRALIGTVVYDFFANSFADYDEDEEEKKKKYIKELQYSSKNIALDLLSPVPVILDDGVVDAINSTLESMGIEEEYRLPESKGQKLYEKIGLTNIMYQKTLNFKRIALAGATGIYTDKFGNEKKLAEEDQEKAATMVAPYLFYTIGLMPADIGIVVDKVYYKLGKKATSTKAKKSEPFGKGFDTKFK